MKINLQDYNLISFDIFDTLVKRPYLNPTDLFIHLGKIFNENSFAEKRIKAEKQARMLSKEQDITLDEIYQQLPSRYQIYKEREKLLEINNCFANQEVFTIYQEAIKLNKKVIAVSDMYLDRNTISKLLTKAGYPHFDKIYVSSEYKKTKGSGDLFEIVLKDLSITPDKILHIGDNYRADFIQAKNKGLNAICYTVENLIKGKIFNKFKIQNYNLEQSVLYSLCNNYYNNCTDYWQKFGFTYGGILCLSFILWFQEQIKNKNFTDILFISRDGWILKQVFDLLYPKYKSKTHYIYASRQICKNVKLEEYKKYLQNQKMHGESIALVDTITSEYTAQKFLQQFFTKDIIGYYWRLLQRNENKAFAFENTKTKVNLWEIMEFIMTAPELPSINIKNKKVIFAPNNNFETKRRKLYSYVSKGITDFIKAYKKIDCRHYFNIDDVFVINWLNSFFFNLREEDLKQFSIVYHTANHAEQEYCPLLPENFCSWSKLHLPPILCLDINQFGSKKLKLFNKITICKEVICKNKKIFYFCRIPIKSKDISSSVIINKDIKTKKHIKLKNNSRIFPEAFITKNTRIGKYSYIGEYSKIDCNVNIGNYCSIADNVFIGATKHPKNWLSTSPFQYHLWLDNIDKGKCFEYSLNTNIGNDVWIGTHAVIMTGIHIGDGSIIGAGAVVCKNVPPYAIVAGVPAKIIGYRFEKEIIKELLNIQWWNLPHNEIIKLPFEDINKCLEILKKISFKNSY